jgi:hypothetical protein
MFNQHMIRRALLGCALTLVVVAGGSQAAPASGDRYRVTSKVEIKDMPFAMPPRTTEVCTARDGGDAAMVPHDKDCQVLDYRRTGDQSSFRMRCTGKDAMEGDGEIERLGADAYRGRVHAVGRADGETMDMTIRFEGQRIGSCDYASESPAALGAAKLKEICEAQLDAPAAYAMFTTRDAACASYRAPFCQRIGTLAQGLRDPARFPASDADPVWPALAACGHPRETILADACAKADAAGNHAFIGAHCPALLPRTCERADAGRDADFVATYCVEKARALAAQQCEGRGYTAMLSSPYRNFCSRYAATRVQQRNATGTSPGAKPKPASAPGAAPAEAARKPSLRDRFKALKDSIGGN